MSNLISRILADPETKGVHATCADGEVKAIINDDGLEVFQHECDANPPGMNVFGVAGEGPCLHATELRDRVIELLREIDENDLADRLHGIDPKVVSSRGSSITTSGRIYPWVWDGRWHRATVGLEANVPAITHRDPQAEARVPDAEPMVEYEAMLRFLDWHTFGSLQPEGVIVMGASGDGKDYVVRQWAARRRLAYIPVTLDEDSTSAKILGSTGLAGGDTVPTNGAAWWLQHPSVLVVKEATVARESAIFEAIELLEVGATNITVWREGVGEIAITRHPWSLVVFTTNTLNAKHSVSNRAQGWAFRRRAPVFAMRPGPDWWRAIAETQLSNYLGGGTQGDVTLPDRTDLIPAMLDTVDRFIELATRLAQHDIVSDLMDMDAERLWRSAVTAHTFTVPCALEQHWVFKLQEPHQQEAVLDAIKQTSLFPEAELITLP